jgi:hypothetical protein
VHLLGSKDLGAIQDKWISFTEDVEYFLVLVIPHLN